mmetsp:Transcript_5993/g.12690  ORF Transcript_5993/g.12690 Transcript_5993/m.12690 type:complete len:104 (+) Transcript_5993:77-388(+)
MSQPSHLFGGKDGHTRVGPTAHRHVTIRKGRVPEVKSIYKTVFIALVIGGGIAGSVLEYYFENIQYKKVSAEIPVLREEVLDLERRVSSLGLLDGIDTRDDNK